MQNGLDCFSMGIQQLNYLEGIAVFFGLLSVWYAKKENILVFPTGIISVLIYVYLCYGAKLYADMGINAYYFVMSIYGWYVWSGKDKAKHILPISTCKTNDYIVIASLFLVSFFSLRFVLIAFTDSDVPTWDSLTTALFFVAMWLMAKKKIENWVIWIIADIISVPLYAFKGLCLTSFQYFIFLLLAIAGYFSWRRILAKNNGKAS